MPRQRADSLGTHGVALVRHRRRADLRALERLLDLLQVRHQAQVRRDLVRGGAKAREGCERVDVDLARVCLRRDGVRILEAGELRDKLVELLDLVVVAVKEREEARLRTSGALDAAEADVVARTLEVAKVPEQLLQRV